MVDQNDLTNARQAIAEGTANLIIALKKHQNFEMRKLEITNEVADAFREAAIDFVDTLADRHLRELEVGYKPDSHEAMTFSRDSAVAGGLSEALQNTATIDGFDPDDETSVRRVTFYSVGFRLGDSEAILLKRSKPLRPLKRRRLSVFFRDNRIDHLADPVLSFDTDFEIIFYDDWGITTSAADVQSIFRDLDALRDAIREDVQSLDERFPIANRDEFLEACSRDPRMMTKLHSVAQKEYLADVTVEDLEGVIQSHGLPQDLLNEDGEFVYEGGPERRWLILKLLDDDYLESEVTQRRYEVNSKIPR